jgi:hypothetical protein
MDQVNHPKHYTSDPSGVECIAVTRWRSFNIGNAIKYLWRAGLKSDASGVAREVEDLNKAMWYIADEIQRMGGKVTCRHPAMGNDKGAWDAVLASVDRSVHELDAALQGIFGGPADSIHVSHLDHLCSTLTPHRVEALLRAVGGPWAAILDRIADKRAAAAVAKDPGEDVRNKAEAKG